MSIGLAGATGASFALEGLGMRGICFTYERRRSAAIPDSLSNQDVKHRRPVFEPERGGSGRSIGRERIGEVGLLPRAQVQLGHRAWVQLAARWGPPKRLAFLVLRASTNLLWGWSSAHLLVQDLAMSGFDTIASSSPSIALSKAPFLLFDPARPLPEVVVFQPRALN